MVKRDRVGSALSTKLRDMQLDLVLRRDRRALRGSVSRAPTTSTYWLPLRPVGATKLVEILRAARHGSGSRILRIVNAKLGTESVGAEILRSAILRQPEHSSLLSHNCSQLHERLNISEHGSVHATRPIHADRASCRFDGVNKMID
jgi:hypothetical protein